LLKKNIFTIFLAKNYHNNRRYLVSLFHAPPMNHVHL